jgi:hypothetical protein
MGVVLMRPLAFCYPLFAVQMTLRWIGAIPMRRSSESDYFATLKPQCRQGDRRVDSLC